MSYLNRLQVNQLRNLQAVSLSLCPKVNFFYGTNGSGKTSLLESISLIGLGRSFRNHKTRSLIHHDQSDLTVFAELISGSTKHQVGVQHQRNGKRLIRIDGDTANSAAVLAEQLPLQVLNADSFDLIEGSPVQRRRFLDWMVFHVKPEFIDYWKRAQRVIKQRNSLLRRDKITRLDLAYWDEELISLSRHIDQLRRSVFNDFYAIAKTVMAEFSTNISVQLELCYTPGWSDDESFETQLANNFLRDTRDGYTRLGPHRADIKFLVANGKPAGDVLSRGQEKSLIAALHIAQARLYRDKRGQACVFLVDDLMAELDVNNASKLMESLYALNGQVFITGVSLEQLSPIWANTINKLKNKESSSKGSAVFHVKQGVIEQTETIL